MSEHDQTPTWRDDPSYRPQHDAVERPAAPKPPPLPPVPSAAGDTAREALGLHQTAPDASEPSPFGRQPARTDARAASATPPSFERPQRDEQTQQRPHLVPVAPAPRQVPVVLPEPQGPAESRPPLPPAAAAPAPVVVHPPVPASELPPEPEPAGRKAPFWKKELTIGGSRKPKKSKQQKRAAAAAVAAETPVATATQQAPAAEAPAKPKRKPKPKAKAKGSAKRVPKPKTVKTAGGPKVVRTPVWNRKVSLKRAERKRGLDEAAKQHKSLIGLKIGASQLAAARVSNAGGVPELAQIARAELRPGIVVAGELRDPDALAEALKDFFAKHKLPTRGIRLGIANNRIGVRTVDVAGINDPRQLDNAIRFRAQEALPIPIDEAVLDYQVLSEGVDEAGSPYKRVLLVVAYRELVDRYVQACRKAGIRLAGIDLEAFALLRAISAPRAESEGDGAVVAVSVGHQRSTFAVSDGRMCQFTRVLDWGGASLDIALARALELTAVQAGQLKRRMSLVPGAPYPQGISPEESVVALDAVRNSLQAFARELVSSLQFYQNQPESLGIGEIVVTGGTAHLPGIADELQRLTGVQVRVGDPLARVKVGKRVDEGDQIGSLAVAIGLGIED